MHSPHQNSFPLPCPLQEEAGRVGYPLLVKAVMGGGGKGMKLAHDASQLLVGFPTPVVVPWHCKFLVELALPYTLRWI